MVTLEVIMARELLAEVHIKPGSTAAEAHGAAANSALEVISHRWASGFGVPGPDTHVRNVHLHKDGVLAGFRMYLVWGEMQVFGKAEVEQLED